MRYFIFAFLFSFASPAAFAVSEISVGGSRVLEVDRHSYYFGRVHVNSMNVVRFTITNTGETPLTFDSAYISGVGYSATHSCENGLAPQAKCWAEIRYWPPFQGLHSGQFELYFKEDSAIVIDLMGDAYQWP